MAVFLIIFGLLVIFASFLAFLVLMFYYLIKKAVKNGILEAYDIIQDETDCEK